MTLPAIAGYDAWKTRIPDDDGHVEGCPAHDDAPVVYECGGVGEHFCSWVEREINGCQEVPGVCECDKIIEGAAAAAAEAKFDAGREG